MLTAARLRMEHLSLESCSLARRQRFEDATWCGTKPSGYVDQRLMRIEGEEPRMNQFRREFLHGSGGQRTRQNRPRCCLTSHRNLTEASNLGPNPIHRGGASGSSCIVAGHYSISVAELPHGTDPAVTFAILGRPMDGGGRASAPSHPRRCGVPWLASRMG